MSFIQNLFTSRDNNANSATYVGQQDRIWWDPVTNAFYYSDGNTAGGIPVSSSGSGNGVPGGPANSIQINDGLGNFTGSSNLTWSSSNLFVGGNVTITGNLYANTTGNVNLGNLVVQDQTISGTIAGRAITIDPIGAANVNVFGNLIVSPDGVSPGYPPLYGTRPTGWFVGPDGETNAVYIDSFSTGAGATDGSPHLTQRRFSGSQASPTAVTSGQTIGNLLSRGFDGTSFQQNAWSGIRSVATQNFSPTQQGTKIELWTIPTGSNTSTLVARFQNESVQIGDFILQGDALTLANAAANITIGTNADTGYVDFLRPIIVNNPSTGIGVFETTSNGQVLIKSSYQNPNNSSVLTIIGNDAGNYTPPTNAGGMMQITGHDSTVSRVVNDAYGANATVYSQFIGRKAGNTAANPTAAGAGPVLRLAATPYIGNSFGIAGSAPATYIDFMNDAAPASSTDRASHYDFYATAANTYNPSKILTLNATGVVIPSGSSEGITFSDGSYQNTAFLPGQSVSSLTAGAGISLSNTVGNITVTNTGILGITGTANQVIVTSNIAGSVTLGTPQDIGPTSNVQFNNLTVNNLSIVGNVSNVIPSVVSGPIVYVANTATTYSGINNSGLVTGNLANNAVAGMLYSTTSNTWNFDYGNSWGITANTVYGNSAFFNSLVHVGYANATVDFPNAGIQTDVNIDDYGQIVLMNHYQGANSSADIVAVANNGDDTSYYIDMGINSNVYSNADYAVTGANDGYLYVNGGNLVIATQTAGKAINFVTGGTNSTSRIRGTLSDTGLSMVGNITANNSIATAFTGTRVSVSGNVTGGNLLSLGVISAVGGITSADGLFSATLSATGNITGGNLRTAGQVSAAGNITGGNIITSTTVINSGSGISTSGNVTGANLLTGGNVSASGNVDATYLNAGVTVAAVNLYATGVVSATGNVTGGNIRTAGLITATGNITGGNLLSSGLASVTGNITGGNILTIGLISATGNVTGNYFNGNGAFLTGLNAFGNVYANGTAVLATTGSSALTVTPGNNQVITGNNTSKTMTIAVNDNPTFANVSVTGNITVFGNIIANATTYLANVGNILFANTAPLPTAYPGVMEYDGRVLYFTPQDEERGIVPSEEFFALQDDRGLTYASTTPQSLFGVGAHVSNSTRYWFRIKATVSRSAGTNNTALTLGWRGSATPNKVSFMVNSSIGAVSSATTSYMYETTLVSGFTNQLTVTTTNNPPDSTSLIITGMIDVGAAGAGYFEPYISWTGAAAPGSVTVSSLSNFQIYPIGVTGANTVVGNWA